MPSSWATCWVIWEIKAGPLLDWRESRRPKWGMISCMRNCVSSEAVSDIIGKASIHPEKVTMSFISYVRGMFSSVQFSSVAQSCLTLCDPMNHSTPGLPVHHQLPEFTQTHIHRVSDAIQPSHALSSPSPPAPNPSQHQSLFQWVNSSHEVAKELEFQL